jgi:hypothetical protein
MKLEYTEGFTVTQPDFNITAFGNIIFLPFNDKLIPPLPEMSLLISKDKDSEDSCHYQAICVDLELDAIGDSMDKALDGLKNAIKAYIKMEIDISNGSIVEATKNLITTAFSTGNQKSKLIELYQKARFDYAMDIIDSGKIKNPITEEKQRLEKLEKERDAIVSIINELKAA